MVIPSRWMAGGMGLDEFRETMLGDKRMRDLVDYPKRVRGVSRRGDSRRRLLLPLGPRPQRAVRGARPSRDGEPIGPTVARTSTSSTSSSATTRRVPILREGPGATNEPSIDDDARARQAVRPGHELRRLPRQGARRATVPLYATSGQTKRASAASLARQSPRATHLIDTWKVLVPAGGSWTSASGCRIDMVLGQADRC